MIFFPSDYNVKIAERQEERNYEYHKKHRQRSICNRVARPCRNLWGYMVTATLPRPKKAHFYISGSQNFEIGSLYEKLRFLFQSKPLKIYKNPSYSSAKQM